MQSIAHKLIKFSTSHWLITLSLLLIFGVIIAGPEGFVYGLLIYFVIRKSLTSKLPIMAAYFCIAIIVIFSYLLRDKFSNYPNVFELVAYLIFFCLIAGLLAAAASMFRSKSVPVVIPSYVKARNTLITDEKPIKKSESSANRNAPTSLPEAAGDVEIVEIFNLQDAKKPGRPAKVLNPQNTLRRPIAGDMVRHSARGTVTKKSKNSSLYSRFDATPESRTTKRIDGMQMRTRKVITGN